MSETISKTMSETKDSLIRFLTTSPACNQALRPLKKGIEIGLILDQKTELAVFRGADSAEDSIIDRIQVEERPARKPDVMFLVESEAARRLCENDGSDIGEIAVLIMKEIKNGKAKIQVPGNLLGLIKNGYIEILATGGKPLWKYLSSHGITSPAKIIGLFKKMKSRS